MTLIIGNPTSKEKNFQAVVGQHWQRVFFHYFIKYFFMKH